MSRFLSSPALFPARMAGEPWGSERVTLDLPCGPYRISGLSEEQAASLCDRFANNRSDDGAFDITVFRAASSDFLPIDTSGWHYELEIDGPVIVGLNLMARVAPERAAIWTTVTSRDAFFSIVENVLRPLVARRLLADHGVLVHSASAVVEERGFLFPGYSGAGKSTIAASAIAAGYGVLSDDLNAVSGDAIVPLPFSGNLAPSVLRKKAARLHTIVALEKGSREAVRPMTISQTIALLVRCAPYVNRDPSFSDALLDRAHDLARGVRACVLTFRRDGDVWPILTSSWM